MSFPRSLLACLLLASCSGDDPPSQPLADSATGPSDTSTSTDTNAPPDTTDSATTEDAPDGALVDAPAGDSSLSDTAVADSTVADSTVADTTVADSTVADTTVEDTSIADAFDAGSRPHIVGASAVKYAESSEGSNGNRAGAESTGYVLDTTGAVFSGVFEASSPTIDCYRFSTGSATRLDAQSFFGATGLTGTPGLIFLSLGDCSLTTSTFGLDYLMSNTVGAGKDYCLCATPRTGAAGNAYTIELRATP